MKLFYAPGSSSLLPHIVLREAGLPFTAIKIDEHTKVIEGGGDYKKVNPLGYVPPNGTIERTRLQAWLNFFSSEMHKGGFSPLFYKGVPEEGKNVFRARLVA